ncbi:MAG: hypothetical protein KGZ94_02740 [Clostridia bacterium]|nr:hypothetical protein [Clostridia bacterium]
MAFIFIFLDGVGLGREDENNPFYSSSTPAIAKILDGNKLTMGSADKEYINASLLSLDACLGVQGIPQSATGQTSLFTGTNASKILGYHLNAYPNEQLRDVLAERGVFSQLKRNKHTCTFANAYRPGRLKELFAGGVKHYSCSTLITYYAGLEFRSLKDLERGNAVYMDIINDHLRELGYDVKLITPGAAARNLINIAREFSFTLYESFLSDIIGHKGDNHKAEEIVKRIDAFLGSIIDNMNQERDLLLVTSDHGNLENSAVKVHTKNPVPALVIGKNRKRFVDILVSKKDITGVVPAILEIIEATKN